MKCVLAIELFGSVCPVRWSTLSLRVEINLKKKEERDEMRQRVLAGSWFLETGDKCGFNFMGQF